LHKILTNFSKHFFGADKKNINELFQFQLLPLHPTQTKRIKNKINDLLIILLVKPIENHEFFCKKDARHSKFYLQKSLFIVYQEKIGSTTGISI
jgi:hypothetical protein